MNSSSCEPTLILDKNLNFLAEFYLRLILSLHCAIQFGSILAFKIAVVAQNSKASSVCIYAETNLNIELIARWLMKMSIKGKLDYYHHGVKLK